ncbi:MAG: porin family protein [Bacteroidales bacterium]|nr:porin family protein [Bacteroidales bacterium]
MTKRLYALLLALAVMIPAMAQFSIGPRIGMNVNALHFNKDIFNSDNRAGFNGGLEMEFMIPMVGFGFDLSAMYVHRVSQTQVTENGTTAVADLASDYIEIPLNIKYKIGLPVIGKVFTPYIFTGPSFAFRTSKEAIKEFYHAKKSDIAWNFGIGVQLISHLQIGASYGIGLTKAVEFVSDHQSAGIDGKNRYWTVTAAWLF